MYQGVNASEGIGKMCIRDRQIGVESACGGHLNRYFYSLRLPCTCREFALYAKDEADVYKRQYLHADQPGCRGGCLYSFRGAVHCQCVVAAA